jgi:ubiquinone/menaquinone biosynthesis C-methylase UbiE
MQNSGPSPATFFDAINAYQKTEALRTAIELDLFTSIGSEPKSAEAIAQKCQSSTRGIRILADYLTIAGFLKKEGETYQLGQDAAVFLDRKSPAFLGGSVEFLLSPQIRECFRELTPAVRRGGTAISSEGTVSHDNPIWVAFARAMGSIMQLPARLIAEHLDDDLDRPLRVLDIAAGHGLFGLMIAQRFPNARITALDWPNVLSVARENAQRMSISERYELLPGSAFEVEWGQNYDVVLLTNFLHHFDLPACKGLAEKTHRALKTGGKALTLEFIPDADRINPPSTATFALTMLATTASGDAYTFDEYQSVFAAAGFKRSEFHRLPPTQQQLIISHK